MSRSFHDEHDAFRDKPASQPALPRALALLAITLLALAAFASAAHASVAVVDLLNPKAGNFTNNATVTFEYYASLHNLTGCTLDVGGTAFDDTHAQSNQMNSVVVQDIAPGMYPWSITCTNGTAAETSVTRNLTIDLQPPTIVLVSPTNGTAKEIALDIIPNDDVSPILRCSASWNGHEFDVASVARNTHYVGTFGDIAGNGTLNVTCRDEAGNSVTQSRSLTIIPELGLQLKLNKQEYGLGETAQLTVDTLDGANVSIDICPDQQGFVQCATALLGSDSFPQTIQLPYMNKTGQYLIEGTVSFGGQTKANQTRYRVANTMAVEIVPSETPRLNTSVLLTAVIGGGIAPYRTQWRLSNGTTINDRTVINVTHRTAGTFSQLLTVFDQQNNSREANYTYTISPRYSLYVYVKDNKTGELLDHVDVDIDDSKTETIRGVAQFTLEEGTYRIFASAPGYEYALHEVYVNGSGSVTILLSHSVDNAPTVTLRAPAAGSAAYSPVAIRFDASHNMQVACTLYLSTDGAWFASNGTINISGNAPTQEFLRDLAPGSYKTRIDCADHLGRTGSSATTAFTVAQPRSASGAATSGTSTDPASASSTAPSADEIALQEKADEFEAFVSSLDGYGPKEKEVIAVTGFDKNLRATKRAIQQAIRDINDLQFRSDLDDAARQVERKRILDGVDRSIAGTPVALTVTESKTYVKFLKEDELGAAAEQLAGLGGLPADAAKLRKLLAPDQQKFTVSTRLAHVEYTYHDRSTKSVTVVARSFTYAQGVDQQYRLYEVIPKDVAQSARDLQLLTKAEVVKDDPVLRYGQVESITYVIPKRVDFARVEGTKTVIAKQYAEASGTLTGFAIFGGGDLLSVKSPLLILVGLILIAYIAYYLNASKQLRFLLYKIGRKEKVHYLRVLINDAIDNLEGNNYEKADMLYKEIRLTYDTLSVPAKNDLYDDVMALVQRMDSYYFNMVMIELDQHIKANDMEAAIRAYEKLTGTFSRLDPERQQQLIATVTAMARRIGLEVAA